MAVLLKMPKMSDTMTEGQIVNWIKQEGDPVESGECLAELETDKAVLELESETSGVLLKILVEANRTVPLGVPLAVIGRKGEDISGLLEQIHSQNQTSIDVNSKTIQPAMISTSIQSSIKDTGKQRMSPIVKRLAAEHRIDLGTINGSGPQGRIIKRDIDTFLTQQKETAFSLADDAIPHNDIPLNSYRKTMVDRLSESLGPIPHFYLETDVNVRNLLEFKNNLQSNLNETRISLTDIFIKACAVSLQRHPAVNSRFLDTSVRQYKTVNIGIAVATDNALLAPVIKSCETKTIQQIATERAELVRKAQRKKLSPDETNGGTFTISNLGSFGITRFKAVIDPPQAAILAVGCVRDEAVVDNGSVIAGKRMTLTLSCDHRAFDGADGARFLATLKELLEEPHSLE